MTGTHRSVRVLFVGITAVAMIGCEPAEKSPESLPDQKTQTGETSMSLILTSSAFAGNEVIPKRFTGDGEDVSPRLTWSAVPDGAKELALIMDDPDAPTPEPWVHWVIYKIAPGATFLPEGVAKSGSTAEPAGALQGKNSWGNIGYQGPAPPPGHGVHHYHFKLFALDTTLDVSSGLTKEQLLTAMEGHVLAQVELVGTYER